MTTPDEIYNARRQKAHSAEKKYRAANKDRLNQSSRGYYELNRGKILAQKREYRARTKEARLRSAKEYRLRNKVVIREKARQYNKRYGTLNRESLNESARQYRNDNKSEIAKRREQWMMDNPGRYNATLRKHQLKKIYHLTIEEWNLLLQSQGGKCPICGTDNPGGRNWHTDHDHETGKVRGILCARCNLMLGHARDKREVLANAIKYLDGNPI
jgi:hypothetical protein